MKIESSRGEDVLDFLKAVMVTCMLPIYKLNHETVDNFLKSVFIMFQFGRG